MSRKGFIREFVSIPGVATNMAADIISPVTNVEILDNIGFQVTWTSANAVGVIAIEGSIDWDEHLQTGTFYALTFTPALAQPASNNGGYLIDVNQFPYPWIRAHYTATSGTGELEILLSAKAI